MISFEDRMALVRAGYTANQIAVFDKPQTEQTHTEQTRTEQTQTEQTQTEQTRTEQTQTEQTQTEQTRTEQTQTEQQPDFATMMQSINNSMAAMLAAMQAQNIKTADMREPAKESPSDILAKLLNP